MLATIQTDTPPGPVVVAITGASGTTLGFACIRALLEMDIPVDVIMSEKAMRVMGDEHHQGLTGPDKVGALLSQMGLGEEKRFLLGWFNHNDVGAPCASGSHLTRGMVVIPCSMNTLAKIATGLADNLITRAADVMLKEGRRLIVVPRESPFNTIHLRHMLCLSEMGVRIIPPILSFYLEEFHSLDGQIRYTVGKVLDHLGLYHQLHPRWGEEKHTQKALVQALSASSDT